MSIYFFFLVSYTCFFLKTIEVGNPLEKYYSYSPSFKTEVFLPFEHLPADLHQKIQPIGEEKKQHEKKDTIHKPINKNDHQPGNCNEEIKLLVLVMMLICFFLLFEWKLWSDQMITTNNQLLTLQTRKFYNLIILFLIIRLLFQR